MVRSLVRALVPRRVVKAVRAWFDARYISRADHRQDIRDALWEVQTLRREVEALQGEVERLRGLTEKAVPDRARVARWDEAHRLAQETAAATGQLLQNEVLLWQAVDGLRVRELPAVPAQGSAPCA
jgi:hypothetical protein